MGKPITFEQDPLAIFLEYQLPQMVQQANEAEKNRVHELNVLEKQQELGQKNFLLETQVNQGIKQLDGLMTDLQKQEDAIAKTGLISDQFTMLPAEDQSEGSSELTKLVKTDQDHGFNMTIDSAENLNDYLGNLNNKLLEGQQRQEVLNRVEAGIQEGKRRSALITQDLTGDEIITAEDFSEYLKLTGNPFEEGSPEYHGFISEAPGLKEGLDLAKQFKDLDYKDAQIANLNSETQHSLNEMLGGRYGTGAVLNKDIFNERMRLISDGYQALESNLAGTDFMENTPFKMSSFDYTKDKNWYKDPFQMESMIGDLSTNIISQLTHSETGITNPTDDKLDGLMKQYNNTNDAALKKTAMDKIVARLGEIDLSGELDYNSQTAQGIEYMKKQLFHYGELRDAQNLLNQPEQVLQQLQPGGTEADPSGLGISASGPTVEEEVENDVVIPTVTLEDLNNEAALMAQDVEGITSPVLKNKAVNILDNLSKLQSSALQSTSSAESLMEAKNEISELKNEKKILEGLGIIKGKGLNWSGTFPFLNPELSEEELAANNRYDEISNRLNLLESSNIEGLISGNLGGRGLFNSASIKDIDKAIARLSDPSYHKSQISNLLDDLEEIFNQEENILAYRESKSPLLAGK